MYHISFDFDECASFLSIFKFLSIENNRLSNVLTNKINNQALSWNSVVLDACNWFIPIAISFGYDSSEQIYGNTIFITFSGICVCGFKNEYLQCRFIDWVIEFINFQCN